jgi:hypothetical protein
MKTTGTIQGGIFNELCKSKSALTKRVSSYDVEGRNADAWAIKPGETRVLAEIDGPACITHVWMTQGGAPSFLYRDVVLKIYWDNEKNPSINVPLGDFFCLGHGLVNSFCSLPFTASTSSPYIFGAGCALNCYLSMPFNKHAKIVVVNEGKTAYGQYFYFDYEKYDQPLDDGTVYLHAQWRRENLTPGWGPDTIGTPDENVINMGDVAYNNNYVMLDAKGEGHYIGCNISVTNFHGTWWGEGDDMIFIDGEKWPPSLHGTGSEDYFNQAWGMQDNAFLFNGSSIFEKHTVVGHNVWDGKGIGGYQTSYVFHLTNPVRFKKSVKVTIEHGHANYLPNDYSSTAYWYQSEPHKPFDILPVKKREPILLKFDNPASKQTEKRKIVITPEMEQIRKKIL